MRCRRYGEVTPTLASLFLISVENINIIAIGTQFTT